MVCAAYHGTQDVQKARNKIMKKRILAAVLTAVMAMVPSPDVAAQEARITTPSVLCSTPYTDPWITVVKDFYRDLPKKAS